MMDGWIFYLNIQESAMSFYYFFKDNKYLVAYVTLTEESIFLTQTNK